MGVARALAADPPVLLMDEPYSAVDPIVRARLQDELLALQQRVQKTIVLVTHDIDEAIKLADRIAILKIGGILAQVDTPEDLLREPVDEFVADFLGDDRGIKRLSLMRVRQARVSPVRWWRPRPRPPQPAPSWPTTPPTGWRWWTPTAAWPAGSGDAALDGAARVSELAPEPFAAVVHPDTTLKAALDGIVTSRTGWPWWSTPSAATRACSPSTTSPRGSPGDRGTGARGTGAGCGRAAGRVGLGEP